MKRKPTVRISAFPAHWLIEVGSFDDSETIEWSTGQRIQIGDIQVFATSATLGNAPELADDIRLDSVHSIWEATSLPLSKYRKSEYPVQAEFKLRVKLKRPVRKYVLYRAGILKVYSWPRNSSGKILHGQRQVKKFAEILAQVNQAQRRAIFDALNI